MKVSFLPSLFLGACLALATSMASSAFAIQIDEFTDDQILSVNASTSSSTPSVDSLIGGASSSMLGRARTIEVTSTGSSTSLRSTTVIGKSSVDPTSQGEFTFSQDATVRSKVKVVWDGDNVPALNPIGLGGLDITQGDSKILPSNQFQLGVWFFDQAFGSSVSFSITIYSDANRWSKSKKLSLLEAVDNPANPKVLSVPFTFLAIGDTATDAADLKDVGAIILEIDASGAPAADMGFLWFGTDRCRYLPDSAGSIVDECGICQGDNSTCKDCKGVPNGSSGPGTSCSTLLPGVCSSGTYGQNCTCQQNTPSGNERCDNLDNDCDGVVDNGFLEKKGQTCTIGQGLCTKQGQFECTLAGAVVCNASFDDVLACEQSKGCDQVPGSGLIRDVCGVCGGNGTSCLGCDGQPFSNLVNDQCGMCGGDGLSCLDCNNVVKGTASIDRCGVCGGDGNSCLGCQTVNLAPKLTILDGRAKEAENVTKAALKSLRKLRKDTKTKKYILSMGKIANKLQFDNWVLVWTTIPTFNQNCENKVHCQTLYNTPNLEEYRVRAQELRQTTYDVIRRIRTVRKGKLTKIEKGYLKKADSIYEDAIKLSYTVPETHEECDVNL